jgi:hypothetical protein
MKISSVIPIARHPPVCPKVVGDSDYRHLLQESLEDERAMCCGEVLTSLLILQTNQSGCSRSAPRIASDMPFRASRTIRHFNHPKPHHSHVGSSSQVCCVDQCIALPLWEDGGSFQRPALSGVVQAKTCCALIVTRALPAEPRVVRAS